MTNIGYTLAPIQLSVKPGDENELTEGARVAHVSLQQLPKLEGHMIYLNPVR